MQDKESDGSKLVAIVVDALPFDVSELYLRSELARDILTAIKEAGYTVVPREPTDATIQTVCDLTFGPNAITPEELAVIVYRAMITAGEE